jgi:hypothetical protein
MVGFRRFIIRLVELLLIVFVVLITVASALAGAAYGQFMGSGMSVVMFLIWGFSGFLIRRRAGCVLFPADGNS